MSIARSRRAVLRALRLGTASALLGVALVAAGSADAASFSTAATTPDFSQLNDPTWSNFCAPTTSADVVYFFGQTYAGLLQGNGFPPPLGPADTGADSIINGLASLMGTTPGGGTTTSNLVAGLDSYLETFDGDAATTWDTSSLFLVDFAGPSAFQAQLESDLAGGAGVILLIEWPSGAPGGGAYHLPTEPEPGTTEDTPMAHAMTLVGFDTAVGQWSFHDPANNSTHLWLGAGGATTTSAVTALTSLQLSVSGQTANVYGAVVTKPIVTPEPAAAGLLLLAALALAARSHPPRVRTDPR